jgi:hypothetical protein
VSDRRTRGAVIVGVVLGMVIGVLLGLLGGGSILAVPTLVYGCRCSVGPGRPPL